MPTVSAGFRRLAELHQMPGQSPIIRVLNLGQKAFSECLQIQDFLRHKIISQAAIAQQSSKNAKVVCPPDNYLLFVEHPPVYTLGKCAGLFMCWL